MGAYLLFVTAFLASAATPGADTILVTTRAIESKAKAFAAGLGIAVAKASMIAIVYLASKTILDLEPAVITALKVFGVSFLLWKAWQLWRRGGLPSANPSKGLLSEFLMGFTVGFANPQPFAFYLAVIPSVVAATSLPVLMLIALAGFLLVTMLYALLAMPISIALGRDAGKVNRVIAVVLVLIAIWVALR